MNKKNEITLNSGEIVAAQAPIIVSASRSTDIPAFYSDWFFNKLEKGYSTWTNPFSGKKSYISYKNTKLIVFWSKNPEPLLLHLHKLKNQGINSYVQFSLNNYEKEKIELGVPKLEERIDTFKRLVDYLGKGHVIWRNDPLVLSNAITVDILLERIQYIAGKLRGYTEKLVFSFIDIEAYQKVKNNLSKLEPPYREFTTDEMNMFANTLAQLNTQWKYELATCGEPINLQKYGILKNKCIDDLLIVKLFSHDKTLMKHIGYVPANSQLTFLENTSKNHKINFTTKPPQENGQRRTCGCIKSKDIGQYNSCPHLCEYCYANTSKNQALKNYQLHMQYPHEDSITRK